MKKINLKRKILIMILIITTVIVSVSTAYAAGDPLEAINNFTGFMYTLLRAVGVLVLMFSIVQLATALKSHDPSQRNTAIMGIVGSLLLVFVKEMIGIITG